MKYENVKIGDVVEFVDEIGTIIGETADKIFLLHGISRHGHDGVCDKLKVQIGTPVKGSNLHRFAMARELTLIRRAFDFSQPRWQADCRELSEDERKSFLEALEKAFPDLRLHSPIWAKDLYFHRVTNAIGLLSSCCANGDCSPSETATADDVRAFIAKTLSAQPVEQPAEPTSEPTSEAAKPEKPSPYHMAPVLDKNGLMDHYHMVRTIEAHIGKPMDPAKQHALKKIAFGGHRGHKDELKDVREAIKTLAEYAEWLERQEAAK